MARLSFVLGVGVRDLRRGGAAGVAALALVALATLGLGLVQLGGDALNRLVAGWRAELRIVAVLADGDGGRAAGPLVPAVRALPGVAAVRFVSGREALGELRRYLAEAGGESDGLDRLPVNPVPARLVIRPGPGASAADLQRLVDALGRLPGVESVQAAFGWLGPVERVQRAVGRGGLALDGLLGAGALTALIAAGVLARQRRVEETAVLRLAGAPEWTLRAPLVLQAVTLGAAGAGLGVGALLLLTETAAPWTGAWLRTALGLVPLPAPAPPLVGALVGGGAALGLAGGVAAGRP